MLTNANSRDPRSNASRRQGILLVRSRLLERGLTLEGLSKSLGFSRGFLPMGLRRGTPRAIKIVAETLEISIRRCRAMLQIEPPRLATRARGESQKRKSA